MNKSKSLPSFMKYYINIIAVVLFQKFNLQWHISVNWEKRNRNTELDVMGYIKLSHKNSLPMTGCLRQRAVYTQ